MSLKRIAPFGGGFPVKKRPKVAQTSSSSADGLHSTDSNNDDLVEIPNDTKAAIMYLKSIFPVNDFMGRVPAILLKHQIYSIIKDKTIVDRQLNDMWTKNEIRLFNLMTGSDEFAIVMTNDYVSHVKSKMTENNRRTAEKFLTDILPNCIDVSFSKRTLVDNHKLTEDEITHLISLGVLTVRDVGSWWLSIPGVGVFMKNFVKGRKALIRLLKNRRYKEILQKELESRSLSNQSKLGMAYHLHDIIGAELVKRLILKAYAPGTGSWVTLLLHVYHRFPEKKAVAGAEFCPQLMLSDIKQH